VLLTDAFTALIRQTQNPQNDPPNVMELAVLTCSEPVDRQQQNNLPVTEPMIFIY